MEEDILKKILAIGLIYLIGAFIGGTWDPMAWHWVGKIFAVLFVIGTLSKD